MQRLLPAVAGPRACGLCSEAVIWNPAPSAVWRPVSEVKPTLASRCSATASRRSAARDYEQAFSTLRGRSKAELALP